jgi:hypothetical protein
MMQLVAHSRWLLFSQYLSGLNLAVFLCVTLGRRGTVSPLHVVHP